MALIPDLAVYFIFSVIFMLSKIKRSWDTYEWRKFLFLYFVIGQCGISKVILLAWLKLDAEILCTLNEHRMGYIIEANQCANNPELMTPWLTACAVALVLGWVLDAYFAYKLNKYAEYKLVEFLPTRLNPK